MGSPNQSYEFPELSRLGRDAETWALQALAGVEQRAYANAKWTQSRMPDIRFASSTPQQQVPRQRSEPYWGGSRIVREQVAAYVPDKLSPEDEQRSMDETARLLEEVDAYRARVGMPVKHEVTADPVATAAEVQIKPTQAYATVPTSDAHAFNSMVEHYDQTATDAPAVEMMTSDELVPAAQAPQTPMQHVETQLPTGGEQLNYNGKPVGQILDEIGYLHDQAGNE